MRACFIYGFTRSFEWPESKKANSFVIYVVGNSEALVSQLKTLAATKKVGNQDIEIKTSSTFDPSIASNIIYFSPDNELKSVETAASKNKNKGTLVVAETGGAAKSGASINFIFIESKLKFEYNKNSAVKAGLETKEDFKKLAAVVID